MTTDPATMNLDLSAAVPPGITPHVWQMEALEALSKTDSPAPLIEAVMGAGKSIEIVMLCRAFLYARTKQDFGVGLRNVTTIVVSAPTEALVEQLAADLTKYCGEDRVGRFYGRRKDPLRPIMVVCYPSVEAFAEMYPNRTTLWIADECHLSESPRELRTHQLLKPSYQVGFTATPFRGDDKALSLWKDVVYSYGIGQALRDGVLVPWEVIHPAEGVGKVDLNEECIRMLLESNPSGPGIIGAKSIEDAEIFCELLAEHHFSAMPIHSAMSQQDMAKAMSALKSGEVRALVHVNMLTTGVNIPWLSWLMVRRKYTSRTSFIQFFGRGLRASPGKTKCLVFDPWMQLSTFSLEYAAHLGDNPTPNGKVLEQPEDEKEFDLYELPPIDLGLKIPLVTARAAVDAWCRAVLHAGQAAGVAPQSEWSQNDGSWRRRLATDKQKAHLAKIRKFTRHLPNGDIRDGVKDILDNVEQISSGAASDLLTLLGAGMEKGAPARRIHQHWEWASPLPIPPLPKRVKKGLRL